MKDQVELVHFRATMNAVELVQHDGPLSVLFIGGNMGTLMSLVDGAKANQLRNINFFIAATGEDALKVTTFLRMRYPMYEFHQTAQQIMLPDDTLAVVHVENPDGMDTLKPYWRSLLRGGVLSVGGPKENAEDAKKILAGFLVGTLDKPVYPDSKTEGFYFAKKGRE
jgi:hypothetical protein